MSGATEEYVHDLADVAEERARLANLDGLVQTFTRSLEKLFRFIVDFPDCIGLVQVRMKACNYA